MNRNTILTALRDPNNFARIQENVLNVLLSGKIDDFANEVKLSLDEAWEVYLQIKDVVLDGEIIGTVIRMSNTLDSLKGTIQSDIQNLNVEIDRRLKSVVN